MLADLETGDSKPHCHTEKMNPFDEPELLFGSLCTGTRIIQLARVWNNYVGVEFMLPGIIA
jgi:hypothetical protein